ncbi:hypothetical protein ACIQLG_14370 [Terribacillus saccharophilus]|uniref:hypothetical protein n=1 Tax=Terribacillus saccharophilus TaxID=361277 RepID=UPI0038126881
MPERNLSAAIIPFFRDSAGHIRQEVTERYRSSPIGLLISCMAARSSLLEAAGFRRINEHVYGSK